MSTQKPYVRPEPPTKDQLRAMLAQAVRNTQPELNIVLAPATPAAPAPEKRLRGRPAKAAPAKPAAKGRKGRAQSPPVRQTAKRRGK